DSVNVAVKKKWIALTFDDGPKESTTRELFDYIKKENVQATFFMLGKLMNENKELLKEEKESGLIEMGNHSYTHTYFWMEGGYNREGYNPLNDEVIKTDETLRGITGEDTTTFRPPGGNIDKKTQAIKKPIILWSVDPEDWKYRDADTVYNKIVKGAGSGSIVLMHDIYQSTVDAAKRLIDYYKKEGYFFATVSQILGGGGELKNGEVYREAPETVQTMKIY
ncbi:MAG: polysaccharide deacetylase family protein, partial [Clostridiales Family XIII bacterium]|nr:polysaccharide deacetylase family protein [Clostridiales Family XIII bacterium]